MLSTFGLTFVAIFAALDIIGTLPLYAAMTRGLAYRQRFRIVNTSMMVATIVAVVFIFVGEAIFNYLGITIPDFRVAGGLVLLLISLSDLVGKPEAEKRVSGQTGIVPLAVPLITGPGVLATLILQVHNAGYLITLGALLANYVLAWFLLHQSDRMSRLIGKDGEIILSKIASLLLCAIAVAMIRSGIFDAIHAYRSG